MIRPASGQMTMSPSSRRAWVEICCPGGWHYANRSPSSRRAWVEIKVRETHGNSKYVALLAEGVGRNNSIGVFLTHGNFGSPSSRRAWVEIQEPPGRKRP